MCVSIVCRKTKLNSRMKRKTSLKSVCAGATGLVVVSLCRVKEIGVLSFVPSTPMVCVPHPTILTTPRPLCSLRVSNEDDEDEERPAGSFFHPIPSEPAVEETQEDEIIEPEIVAQETNDDDDDDDDDDNDDNEKDSDDFEDEISKLLQRRRKKPLASRPSTINGVPTEQATGFGKPKASTQKSSAKRTNNKPITPYVAIGTPDQPINDPSKPERDDQGYTLYTDTQTGEKSRVFEALVDYPSVFTMKIVGANEGTFVPEMVALVADACETEVTNVKHTTKVMGKWVSVTVKAPVQSAEMLYSLYEKVDLDPRVKFKF